MKTYKNNLASDKKAVPEYPRTRHVPHNPNLGTGDIVAYSHEAQIIFECPTVSVTEKVDGANCGMALLNDDPVIRNREHVLRKGYVKDTPAKKQFASVFNWFYENRDKFERLNSLYDGWVTVYGEWMVAQHGLEYDQLPSFFVTYDLYDPQAGRFVQTKYARQLLTDAGFDIVPEVYYGPVGNYDFLQTFLNQPSPFTTKGLREGIYLKLDGPNWVEDRFKMIRPGFIQGALWDADKIKKNRLN